MKLERKAEAVRNQASRVQDELNEIDNQFAQNREQVIGMLLNSVMNVQLEVPRVVK